MMLRLDVWLAIFFLQSKTLEGKNCPSGLEFEPNCKFPFFFQSCSAYHRLGVKVNAEYIVDIKKDGGVNTVICIFNTRSVQTTIKNDLRKPFILRSPEVGTVDVTVSYTDFSSSNLQFFLNIENDCSQDFRLECRNAHLDWKHNIWYQALGSTTKIRSLGSDKANCKCQKTKCMPTITLKEANSFPLVSLRSTHAPTKIPGSYVSLRLRMKCQKKVTGDTDAITLTQPKSFLKLSAPWHKQEFFFNFKTLGDQGIMFYQGDKTKSLKIYVESANFLGVEFFIEKKYIITTFSFSERLNKGDWHLIYIEAVGDEMRIVVDRTKKFLRFPSSFRISSFQNTKAWLGGLQNKSFYGCIKGLEMNGDYDLLETAVDNNDQDMISLICQLNCQNCAKGVKCEEDKCQCPFPSVDSTEKCNKQKEVVYFNFDYSNIWFRGKEFEGIKRGSIFRSSFGFTFLTNSKKANLFTAVNQDFNVIQVILMESNKILVLFNKYKRIASVHVKTESIALNEGQPVRIEIIRTKGNEELPYMTIQVITRGQTFEEKYRSGMEILTNQNSNPFKNVPEELVDIRKERGYTKIFFGAIKDKFLESKMKGFIGCFQNFKMESLTSFGTLKKYDLKINAIKSDGWQTTSLLRNKCDSKCEYDGTYCENRSICTQRMNSSGISRHNCRCSNISYIGEFCNSEISYYFNGKSAIASGETKYKFQYNEKRFLKFTFSLNLTSKHFSGKLLKVTFHKMNSKDEIIGFYVDPEKDLQIFYVFGTTYRRSSVSLDTRTRRHVVICQFNDKQYIQVDKKIISHLTRIAGSTLNKFWEPVHLNLMVGGSTIKQDMFKGCISNIVIETDMDGKREPLIDYKNGDNKFKTVGTPLHKNECMIDDAIRGSDISPSLWMKKKLVEKKEENFFSLNWLYFLVAGLLLIIILFAVFGYRKYKKRKKTKRKTGKGEKKKKSIHEEKKIDDNKLKTIPKRKGSKKKKTKHRHKNKMIVKPKVAQHRKEKHVQKSPEKNAKDQKSPKFSSLSSSSDPPKMNINFDAHLTKRLNEDGQNVQIMKMSMPKSSIKKHNNKPSPGPPKKAHVVMKQFKHLKGADAGHESSSSSFYT